jgi:hypothetical protein
MGLFWATRDYDINDFHIEQVNPKYYRNVGINQVWEINDNDGTEAEIFVEEETLEQAAIKALNLFIGI